MRYLRKLAPSYLLDGVRLVKQLRSDSMLCHDDNYRRKSFSIRLEY